MLEPGALPDEQRRRLHQDLALLVPVAPRCRRAPRSSGAHPRADAPPRRGGCRPTRARPAAFHPTISPPISVWPQQLSTVIPKRSRNRRACSGDSGAVMLRTYFIGSNEVTDSSSDKHRHRRRRQHGRPQLEAGHEVGERLRVEPVHHDHRRRRRGTRTARCRSPPTTTTTSGIRFGIGALRGCPDEPLAAQLLDHGVEQLEHARVAQEHRLRPAGRARGELDQRDVGFVHRRVGHDRAQRLPGASARGQHDRERDPAPPARRS